MTAWTEAGAATANSKRESGFAWIIPFRRSAPDNLMSGRFRNCQKSSSVVQGHCSTYKTSSPNPDILRLNPVSMPEIAVPIKVTAMIPIATPNVVSIDLARFAATCRAAMRKPSIHSARFFIALDSSIPQSHNSPGVPRDIFFVSHDDDRVAALIKILQQHHDLFASPRVEIPGRFVRQN